MKVKKINDKPSYYIIEWCDFLKDDFTKSFVRPTFKAARKAMLQYKRKGQMIDPIIIKMDFWSTEPF